MLIDISDVSTIPAEIKQKIGDRFMALHPNTVSKIKACKIQYDRDVTCAIDDYLGPRVAYDFYDMLISLFEQHEIICYHSTKVLNEGIILSEGLKTNEWDIYRKNIIHTLQMIGVGEKEITEAVEIIKQKYDWKYPLHDREPQLCFYSDISLLREGMSAGYEQFCENIGGELARDALKGEYPDLYKYFRENGKAFVVKFKIPFSNIKSYDQDSIIFQFVAYFAGKYFWNYKCEIHFDGNTDKAVPAGDTVELIPYTVDRYYFNE